MNKYKLSWILYLIGSLLVFGSWVHLVPTWLAWIGWLAALGGWAMGSAGRQQTQLKSPSRMEDLSKLNLLHKEGIVTDEEFQHEKDRILRQP